MNGIVVVILVVVVAAAVLVLVVEVSFVITVVDDIGMAVLHGEERTEFDCQSCGDLADEPPGIGHVERHAPTCWNRAGFCLVAQAAAAG